MGEFRSSGNVVPQQSLSSMSGMSLAVWTMTLILCALYSEVQEYLLHMYILF